MPSESIKILIEADDLASATAKQTGKSIEQSIQGVKDVGGKAKASTEFIGVLAGQLGGNEFATAAQGIAGITEKVGQFSEIMKVGGKGAMIFQAGIAALVGIMSFQLGKTIGEAIFGVDDLAGRMEDAASEADRFADHMVKMASISVGDRLEDLTLIRDPDQQQKAAVELFHSIGKEVDDAVASFQYYTQAAEKALETNQGPEVVADLNNQAAGYMKVAQALREEQNRLGEKYSAHAQQVRLIKEQQAAEDAAAAKKAQIDASVIGSLRNVNYQYIALTKSVEESRRAQLQDQGVGEADIKRIMFAEKMLKAEQDADAAKKKAQDAEKQRLEKIEDLRKSELSRLEEQKIALEQGQQAAHSYRLQQQGLDKATADAIAAAQAQADAMASAKDEKAIEAAAPVTAKESRLMTRGRQDDSQKKIEQNTAQTVDKLDKVKEAIEGLRNSLQTGPGITFSGTGP
jgi:hypothetical protein